MLEVVQAEYIRWLYFRQGKSIRAIAKELRHSRKTVRKVLELDDVREHRYDLKRAKPCLVTDPVKEIILQWLEEDKQRPVKQRHTARRIYERLVEEHGFQGAESTIRRLVRHLRQDEPREVYIPLAFGLGLAAQFDWGEAQVILNGQPRRVYLFCMRLCASRVGFVMAFLHQHQEAFFEGHREAFEFFGGVPQRVIYDNLKTAVQKVLKGTSRREQVAFLALRSHYLFQADFCNTGRAHEKGQIENLVRYCRRNFLVPVPECASLAELNKLLREKCLEDARTRKIPQSGKLVAEVWAEEREALLPLPPKPFSCCRLVEVKSDGYARVRFENNYYSVPAAYARRWLTVKAFTEHIEVWCQDRYLVNHKRLYGRGQESLMLDHYLDELLSKPRALRDARPFQATALPPVYRQLLQGLLPEGLAGVREFIKILRLARFFGDAALARAVQRALDEGTVFLRRHPANPGHLTRPTEFSVADHPSIPAVKVAPPDPARFDRLLRRCGGDAAGLALGS